MKYFEEFRIYEAFDSNVITKITKFLSNSKNGRKEFIKSLTDIMKSYDLPINRIKDSHVKYVTAKEGVKIKNTDYVENGLGIYCLKFWFSINTGYLGFTATGNKRVDFNKDKPKEKIKFVNKFTEEEIDYIKNVLGIKSGTLKPLPVYHQSQLNRGDISDLKMGDEIIAYFSSTFDKAKLTLAKIYKPSIYAYAIQNVSLGDKPSDSRKSDINWKDWGELSWSIDGDDTKKPHLYYREVLNNPDIENGVIDSELSKFNFNLPLALNNDGIYMFTDWVDYFGTMNFNKMDYADYCIVLYLDDVLKTAIPINQIKLDKIKNREGSTKLMSDDQIRQSNKLRYDDEILNRNENYAKVSFATLWDRETDDRFNDINFKFFFNRNDILTKIENVKNFEIPKSWINKVTSNELTSVIMDYFDQKYKIHRIRIKYGKKYKGDIFNIDKFEYFFQQHISGNRRFKDIGKF